jgi:hypothetical protein
MVFCGIFFDNTIRQAKLAAGQKLATIPKQKYKRNLRRVFVLPELKDQAQQIKLLNHPSQSRQPNQNTNAHSAVADAQTGTRDLSNMRWQKQAIELEDQEFPFVPLKTNAR